MGEVNHSRKLDEVQRGVETALRNFAGNGTNGNEPSELTAMERINKIGNMSALAIAEASETTANDIKAAGQAAVDDGRELFLVGTDSGTVVNGVLKKLSRRRADE